MCKQMRKQAGFTLIEQMIVIAIIGILAAVAIPAYQDYIARAQASEGMTLMAGMKTSVTEWHSDRGAFPTGPGSVNGVVRGKYVGDITFTPTNTTNFTMTATYQTTNVSARIATTTLTILTTSGGQRWACAAGTIPTALLPGGCR